MAKRKDGSRKESGRKSKRKARRSGPPPAEPQPDDPMTKCVLLCQEQRWREAALLCRTVSEESQATGKDDLAASLTAARKKIEYSLRRQMAAAVVRAAQLHLKKEYLLDVGE